MPYRPKMQNNFCIFNLDGNRFHNVLKTYFEFKKSIKYYLTAFWILESKDREGIRKRKITRQKKKQTESTQHGQPSGPVQTNPAKPALSLLYCFSYQVGRFSLTHHGRVVFVLHIHELKHVHVLAMDVTLPLLFPLVIATVSSRS